MTRRSKDPAVPTLKWAAICALGLLGACGEPPAAAWTVHTVLTPEGVALPMVWGRMCSPLLAVARHRETGRLRSLEMQQPLGTNDALQIQTAGNDEDVFLWVSGCRELKLLRENGAAKRQLEYGQRVRLRVRTEGPIPGPPFELQLVLNPWEPAGEADGPLRRSFSAAAPEGWFPRRPEDHSYGAYPVVSSSASEALVHVSRPGAYTVTWALYRVKLSATGRKSLGSPPLELEQRVEVREGVEDETIEIDIPGAALREARRALGG